MFTKTIEISAVLWAAISCAGLSAASAAIRVTIEDGTAADTRVFLFEDSGGQTGLFVMDGVEIFASTTTSNLPTTTAVGSLNTTVNITDFSDPSNSLLPTFTITAQFVDAFGNPLLFTGPAGSTLSVKSDVDAAETDATTVSGTVQNRTIVNGVSVTSLAIPVTGGDTEADITNPAVPNPTNSYTLSSIVTISGLNVGSSIGITAASSVTGNPSPAPEPIPEPSSMVVLGLGAIGLAIAARRRRRLPGAK